MKVGSNYEMNGGYRVELFRQAVLAGKSITFVGARPENGPDMVEDQPFPKKHQGTSGIKIGDINKEVPSPALNDEPNIILVHIGTNDLVQNTADPNTALDNLLDDLIAGAPDALIVVASIIPLTSANDKVTAYNQHVVDAVEARAESAHIQFVDQFADFPPEELGDGVHPNDAGYARMGQKWFNAIEQYLK